MLTVVRHAGQTHRPPPAGAGSVVNRCGGGWSAVADRAVRPRPATGTSPPLGTRDCITALGPLAALRPSPRPPSWAAEPDPRRAERLHRPRRSQRWALPPWVVELAT